MNKKVDVLVLRTAGTNCDQETAFAFKNYGAKVDLVHINQLLKSEKFLKDYHILAIPGGFTYGDDIESGRILANELKIKLGEDLRQFVDDGKLVIGICNGFQVMVKAGILPRPINGENKEGAFKQMATLMNNDSGKFEDRWIHLKVEKKSVWTEGLPDLIYLPVAHGEGKFVPSDEALLQELKQNNQVAFRYSTAQGDRPRYPENPNGSVDDIAGITDPTGRILGLMPHPERHFLFIQHPQWTRLIKKDRDRTLFCPYKGDGARIFENGINYARKNLL